MATRPNRVGGVLLVGVAMLAAACTATPDVESTTTTTTVAAGPVVIGASLSADTVPAYDKLELVVDIDAEYGNPFDQREVTLDATFSDPDGRELLVPGFWDAASDWRIRFTPDRPGEWSYSIVVADSRGTSSPLEGSFEVERSDHRGFLRIASDVDPSYSSRYLAWEDGTPWYGRGYADLDMSFGGAAPDGSGLRKIQQMPDWGGNYEMWWPTWANNFIQESYDNYTPAQLRTIDFVVNQAEEHEVGLVFTVWTHQYLRTADHAWPGPRWTANGFSKLTDIDGFFVDEESWAWQENYYRYIIARWSYSTAVIMWQTITEINGTESYEQTDPWHEKLNAYFKQNDPFEHPTTATGSGDWDWPTGHLVMDVAQMHSYHEFRGDPIYDSTVVAHWTSVMRDRVEKPNWLGEYGYELQRLYPEWMHHANWATLGAGAAMSPIEWNDQRAYGYFDDAMKEDMKRFADFVEAVPLAHYAPQTSGIVVSDGMRGWGMIGERGGVIWIQDANLEGLGMEAIRSAPTWDGVTVTVDEIAGGSWTIRPYNTWTGEWLTEMTVECTDGPCSFEAPTFSQDLAFALSR